MNGGDSPAKTLRAEMGAREPDMTLNLPQAYHMEIQLVAARSTINIQLRDGKLGKVTQTEVIRK